jgi:hypothetical protein
MTSLAGALLRRAVATFRVVPPEQREPALAAIDAFLADPTPARLVASSAVLGAVRRAAESKAARATIARHGFERGLASISAVPGVPEAIVQALQNVVVDARTGARLEAIAALLIAHRELAGKAAAETLALRRRLGYEDALPTTKTRSNRR